MSDMGDKTLGQMIREARKNKKMSQEELAQKTGMSRANVGFMEVDKYRAPGPGHIARIAEVLDLNKEELFTLVGYATPTVMTQRDIILRQCLKDLEETNRQLRIIINKLSQVYLSRSIKILI
jgi:transcriptional regulator with XRE-family HTH domain